MASRKDTDFLGIDAASDDELSDRGYDSDEKEAQSKGRAVKRRRTEQDFFGLASEQESEGEEEEEEKVEEKEHDRARTGTTEKESARLDTTAVQPKSKSKSQTKSKGKKSKPGVVYMATLPPYLKPMSLKSMLEKRGFGPITKVFLSPLVPSTSAPRGRSNKRKRFADGWIEFASKRTAKIAAETLNACTIGGRGYYADDVWNMKYLKGYSWEDLTEQISRERSEREAKRRMEDSRSKKEEKVFLAGVEAGRVADGMARKNEEKRKRKLDAGDGDEDDIQSRKPAPVRRRFTQNDVVGERDQGAIGDDAKRVLGKIF
ncbi:uncharacterized protein N7459_004817 [Penicillium hispanicum]|uniref:uncharacterized protein n=1 Tax=Penicillium hispanicum TaxID=1080232 RepID=UPI00253F88B0|nr:uncharacterized protein N7459_004817 [Penicillium hispanicum]KAJ5585017.1 hypothetical protein N7459_004817 [Penicillium hispanicum]